MTGALLVGFMLAAVPITLEEARTRARDNLQSLQAALEAERTGQVQRAARGALLPQLSVGATAGGRVVGPQEVIDPETLERVPSAGAAFGDFRFSATLRQLIYDSAQWSQLAESGAVAEATRGEALEQQATSELEGIRRFYVLFRAQQSLAILESNVKRSEDQVALSEALFRAGRSPQSEVLQARVNLGNDRISVLNQRAQVAAAQADLATWLAQPGTTEFVAQDPGLPEQPVPVPPAEEAMEQAKQARPLLVALSSRVRAAEAARSRARAGFLPRLYAEGNYIRQGPDATTVFLRPDLQYYLTGGLALQWDLFNGFSDAAQTAAAGAVIGQQEARLTQAERDLEAEVRKALVNYQLQVEAAQVARENREIAATNLNLVTERFKAGVSSTLEVRDAQFKLTQAELTLVQYRVDVEVARAALDRAMGTLGGGDRS